MHTLIIKILYQMKTLFLLTASVLLSLSNKAQQVTKVSMQASGLTCSMCSNAINKSLKTIDYVEKVMSNIQTSTFEITFKPGSKVDFDKLKLKVEDAGFFVSKFVASVNFNNISIKANEPVTIGDKTFHFVNTRENVLNGSKSVRILNKGFVSSKEFKKNALSSATGAKVYYVTI
jgi:copper chaperone CopZ